MELTFLQRSPGSGPHAFWEPAWLFYYDLKTQVLLVFLTLHSGYLPLPRGGAGTDQAPWLVQASAVTVLLPGRLQKGTVPLLHMGFSGGNILSTSLWDHHHTDDQTRDTLASRPYFILLPPTREAAENKQEGELRWQMFLSNTELKTAACSPSKTQREHHCQLSSPPQAYSLLVFQTST